MATPLIDVIDKDLLVRATEARIREVLANFFKGERTYLHEIGGIYMGEAHSPVGFDHNYQRDKYEWQNHAHIDFEGRCFALLQGKPEPTVTIMGTTEEDLLKCQGLLVDALDKWYSYVKVVKEQI
jgi:hypothetical protein